MKLSRFTLTAAVLALGAVACGDDVQVVEPTPPQPPPPPPVTATMAPASASVAVGNSVVFAVNASGGVAGEGASWTCSSSNTGIATVTSTSAGCSATGVAAGDVTITASVTKSGETVNVGAQLTVVSDEAPPADAIVTIFSILSSAGTPAVPPISGRVNVVVNLVPGNSVLERLDLLVDGEVVAHQSFTGDMGGMAAPAENEANDQDGAAEQAVVQTVLTVDTHAFDTVDGVGIPKFANGDHVISAQLSVVGSMAVVTSNEITIRFRNSDRLNLTLTADGNQAMDRDGLIWHGGSVTAMAVPVIYSGGDIVSQVEFELHDVEAGTRVVLEPDDPDTEDDELTYVASITDDEAPFEVTWPDDADVADDAPQSDDAHVEDLEPGGIAVVISNSAFADGSAGPTTAVGDDPEDKSHFVRLDNLGPSVSNLHRAMLFNRHYDITNWVGANHAFTFSSSSTTPDFSDGGVGRDRGDHEYHAGTSTGGELKLVSTPNDLDETSNNRAYVLRATIRDHLGNETMRWWAGADDMDGRPNTGSNRRAVDGTDDYKFGVDLTAPTQELLEGADYLKAPADVISNLALSSATPSATRSVGIDYDDPGSGSGFSGSNVPVHTRIRRYAPDLSAADGCLSPGQAYWHSPGRACNILGDPGSNQWRAAIRGGTVGEYDFDGQGFGYYAIEYAVMDDAGNRAPFIQVGGVLDNVPPVGSALVPAAREAGSRSTLSAFASDNLDLAQIDYFLGFGADAYQVGSESVGGPSLSFEQSANASVSVETLAGAVATDATTAEDLAAHVARITDQAGNATYVSTNITGVTDTPDNILATATGVGIDNMDDAGTTLEDNQTKTIQYIAAATPIAHDLEAGETLCWDTDDDGCEADASQTRTTLTFSIQGTDTVTDPTTAATDASTVVAAGAPNPFERVIFYAQLPALPAAADGVTTAWAYLGESRGRPPSSSDTGTDGTNTQVTTDFTWRLNVRGADVGATRGLTSLENLDEDARTVTIRAVGYTADGTAVATGNVTVILTED
ncbi:MAG: Ig-like domain-containing protein [Gammaproteobacteria bacterium]|nr:Ig-like domain-containing protein [Gammaproteobacteria bacterium]